MPLLRREFRRDTVGAGTDRETRTCLSAGEGADSSRRQHTQRTLLLQAPRLSKPLARRYRAPMTLLLSLLDRPCTVIAVATPHSTLDSYVELRNSADGTLAADSSSGPGSDAFISHFVIDISGNYFARVRSQSGSTGTGTYQLRVDLAREINHESDASYAFIRPAVGASRGVHRHSRRKRVQELLLLAGEMTFFRSPWISRRLAKRGTLCVGLCP